MKTSANLSRRSFLTTAAAGAGVVLLAGCSSGSDAADEGSAGSAASGETYTIATDTTFAPFEYADENNEYVGIDIDMLYAIAEDQGFQVELDALGFQAATEAVQSGQADGIIAGMSITEERKETFDFSDPYFDSTVCCAADPDSGITSLEDLEGLNVAVKIGTMSADWAESIADEYGFTMTTFETSDMMYQEVGTGNSAACFEDTPVMEYAIATGSVSLEVIADCGTDSEFASQYGFGVKKGENAELLEMFNAGLANIREDGTYDEIVATYLGE